MSAEVSPIGVEYLHFLSLVIFFQLFNLVTTDTSESKYVGARVNGRYTDSSSHRMVSMKLHTHICVERAQTQPPSNSICCVTDALQCTFCLRFLLCFPLSLYVCSRWPGLCTTTSGKCIPRFSTFQWGGLSCVAMGITRSAYILLMVIDMIVLFQ